jgi:outer membrane immunogenic protein
MRRHLMTTFATPASRLGFFEPHSDHRSTREPACRLHRLIAASLIAVGLSAGTGAAASAADLPPSSSYAKAAPPVAYNWTGLYAGVHVGSGWATNDWEAIEFLTVSQPSHVGSGIGSGFLGGAQVGVNYQVDAVVLGIEADTSWAAVSGDTCNIVEAVVHCNSKADRLSTITGRFGVAADRALVYLKGGRAWLHSAHVLSVFTAPDALVSDGKWGWTGGVGVEYALTRNWSAKIEYDFMDFGTSHFDFEALGTSLGTFDIKQQIQTVKFGLNYKLDWGGPIAAGR